MGNNPKKVHSPKILIFRTGAIGDVLMTTPLIRSIRKEFPQAEIVYYVGEYSASVLQNNPFVDRIEEFSERKIFFKRNIPELFKLIRRISGERFDIVFTLEKHWIFGLITLLSGIKTRVGFFRSLFEYLFPTVKIKYSNHRHEIDNYFDLLDKFFRHKVKRNYGMDIDISAKDKLFAGQLVKSLAKNRIIGISAGGGGQNPGESGAIRKWPAENYEALIKLLIKDYPIILFGGPQDHKDNQKIIRHIGSLKVLDSAGQCDLHQSAALMQKCVLIVTHDSGPMHLAAAAGCRTVTIFGPTNPLRKAPLSNKNIFLWTDQDIYEPAYEYYGRKPDLKKKWMRNIAIQEVYNSVTKMLKS